MKNPGILILGASFLNGFKSYTSNSAFYLIVEEIIFKAPDKMNAGIFEFLLHKSNINYFKLLNGLSITATFISGFIFKYLKAVTAPMDRPHKPTYVTLSFVLKYLYTSSTSFHS